MGWSSAMKKTYENLLTNEIIAHAVESTDLSAQEYLEDSSDGACILRLRIAEGIRDWEVVVFLPMFRQRHRLGGYPEMSLEEARRRYTILSAAYSDDYDRVSRSVTPAQTARHLEEQFPKDMSLIFIDQNALADLHGKCLFYPCSGADLLTPLRLFSPFVQDFWFVDRGYFSTGHQDTRHCGLDRPAKNHTPVLDNDPDYKLLQVSINGPDNLSPGVGDIEPCIRREVYEHLPTMYQVSVRKRRGYGFSCFRKDIQSLGVFFYRGDSHGEGGSGNHWLKKEHIREVLEKLNDRGLMVLDGSDGLPYNRKSFGEYSSFWKYKSVKFRSQQEVLETCKPFRDRLGNEFRCVGYLGWRYGNTLAWQVKKS
jgi:hypothetical protein